MDLRFIEEVSEISWRSLSSSKFNTCGGPPTQNGFCGSWAELFGVDVVEGSLILEWKS